MREHVYELTSSALDLLTSDRELKHYAAVLAILLVDLGRWDFVNALTSGALDLKWTCDELKHASAVVANKMTFGLRGDSLSDTELTIWHMHEEMLICMRDVITHESHRIT